MGLLGMIMHRGKGKDGNGHGERDLDVVVERLKAEQVERDEEWRRRSELLERDDRPLSVDSLETGVPALPIKDGPHLAKRILIADVDAGTTYVSRVDWYAWPDEIGRFAAQLGALEGEFDGFACVPRLRSDMSHPTKQREGDEPAGGTSACLVVNPPTRTGRAPKYPVDIVFGADGGSGCTDSHGRVCYLKDGRPGKADVMYCGRSVSYEVAWRMSGDRLLPSSVYAHDLATGAGSQVWMAE